MSTRTMLFVLVCCIFRFNIYDYSMLYVFCLHLLVHFATKTKDVARSLCNTYMARIS